MLVQPYLFFEGRCEEALEFYKKAIDAEVTMLMRNKDNPEPQPGMTQPELENKVLHSEFKVGDTVLMASDGFCREAATFKGFGLSISVATASQAHELFAALGEGGKVDMPLAKTFFSEAFGMVTDKFGVGWMVGVHEQKR